MFIVFVYRGGIHMDIQRTKCNYLLGLSATSILATHMLYWCSTTIISLNRLYWFREQYSRINNVIEWKGKNRFFVLLCIKKDRLWIELGWKEVLLYVRHVKEYLLL